MFLPSPKFTLIKNLELFYFHITFYPFRGLKRRLTFTCFNLHSFRECFKNFDLMDSIIFSFSLLHKSVTRINIYFNFFSEMEHPTILMENQTHTIINI